MQTGEVLELVRRVRDSGVAVAYISHNIPEVLEIADSIEMLYTGSRVASVTTSETSVSEIVSARAGAYDGGKSWGTSEVLVVCPSFGSLVEGGSAAGELSRIESADAVQISGLGLPLFTSRYSAIAATRS